MIALMRLDRKPVFHEVKEMSKNFDFNRPHKIKFID